MAFRVDTSSGTPELYLYGEIAVPMWYMDAGEVIGAQDVVDTLAGLATSKEIVVRINSPGGDVFEGVAIYQALQRFPGRVRVEVDALAASIASVIAMAGAEIVMAGNAMLMIHRAWTIASGNADELSKTVDALRKVDESILNTYAARVGEKVKREDLDAMVAAETWLTADEAVANGFADRAGELRGVSAAVREGMFKNTPRHLLGKQKRPEQKPAARQTVPQIAARLERLRTRIG